MDKLHTVNKTRLGADCGSDHELFIAKFILKLKKIGNHILYDYIVEVRNRCEGLELIECLTNYGQRFMTLYRRQGSRSPQEKEMQKAQLLSEEALK